MRTFASRSGSTSFEAVYYTEIPAIIPTPFPGDAVTPGPATSTSHRLLMDHALYNFKIFGERADLIDGRRIYRIQDRFFWLLPKDAVSSYIEFAKTKYRWTATNPVTENDAYLHEWGPV